MKIYVDKKPKSCKECELKYAGEDYGTDGETCILTEDFTEDIKVYANCPLTELKPKELEWEDLELDCHKAERYFIEYCEIDSIYKGYFDGKTFLWHISLEELKRYCKEHNEYLFWEMLGGEK